MKNLLFSLSFFIFSIGFSQNSSFENSYNLTSPDEIIELPEILLEISGLTDIDQNTIACVQDELGLIFNYSIRDRKIIDSYRFGNDGDYEGITYTGSSLFILRSDGMLIECSNIENSSEVFIDSIQTNIPARDNEGLCYDKLSNRLLIGCKSKPGKGPDFKNRRDIYGFDLEKRQLSSEPVFEINIEELIAYAQENNIELPSRIRKKDQESITKVKIGISALAIHPITGEFIILSAVDHMMLIYDHNGKFKELLMLDIELFQKAEGITFLENADMLISNEGVDSKPTLLRFNYSPIKGN